MVIYFPTRGTDLAVDSSLLQPKERYEYGLARLQYEHPFDWQQRLEKTQAKEQW